MKNLLVTILLGCQWQLHAQSISKKQGVEDLDFLRDRIVEFNPALPIYHPQFDKLSTRVIEELTNDSISAFAHLSNVSRICALASEGHFSIGDRNDYYSRGILENTFTYLPIQVKIIAGELFVVGDFSHEQQLDRGDRIIAINELKSTAILNQLLEMTPSDGDIKTYAYRKIEDRFASLFYYHIERPKTFSVTIRDKNQNEKTYTVEALSRADQISNIKKYYPKEDNQQSDIEGFYAITIAENYAYIKFPSFDFRRVRAYEVKSKKLYQTIFQKLKDKKINNLIIDLRDNTGGRNEFADDMVPFIRKGNIHDPFLKKTISWSGKTKTYKLPKPSKLAFQGEIYVLVNGKTFSAGSTLARYLKEYGNAQAIGIETGTRYEGFAAGSNETVVLPNSKLPIGIPRYHIVFPESSKQKTNNRGLLPDHELEVNFDNFVNKKDPYLEKAISLINQE